LGDVAYGACCVDDQGALASAGAEVLIHYGHSCLVPVQRAAIPTIYVFVHISCDVDHLISTIELNFYKTDREGENGTRTTGNGDAEGDEKDDRTKKRRKPIAIAGTVQFAPAVAAASAAFATNAFRPRPVVPQSRPLSPGEVLGCTAPRLEMEEEEEEEEEEEVEEEVDEGEGRATSTSTSKKKNPKPAGKEENRESSSSSVEALVFVADGRFHMEALMIANPTVPAFRYDPYSRVLTREEFDHRGMRRARKEAISLASREERWGIVLGTLGRQGSREVLAKLVAAAQGARKEVSVVLVSELSPAKLAALTKEKEGSRRGRRKKSGGIGGLDEKNPENGDKKDDDFPFFAPPRAWAQVACPRLSIDWGEGFGGLPVLTPYEAMVALGVEEGWWVGKKEEEKKKENSSPSSAGCCGGGESGCGGKSSEKEYSPVVDLEGDPDRGHYPMDYYSSTGGAWAGTYHRASAAAAERARAAAAARARRKATSGGGGVVRRAAAATAAVS
jgi:2-(3-amino-3-carboxypropyl)histidine synthase